MKILVTGATGNIGRKVVDHLLARGARDVRALTNDPGKAYSLAGPEALSRGELLRQLGEALGREIPFLEVSREEAVEALTPSMGENAGWYVHNILAMFAETPGAASTTVEEITGHPATTFARWAAEHTGDFTG